MTEPVSRQIGTISRLRNRSTTSPLSRCTISPLCSSSALGSPASAAAPSARRAPAARSPRPSCSIVCARDAALGRAAAARAPPAGAASCSRKYAAAISCTFSSASRSAASRRASSTCLVGLGQRHAELLRQHPHRVLEADLLVQLEELEHVAADAAAEAVEEPLVGIDVERRRLLGVKRAEALVGRARPLQRHVLLHDLHDVRLQAEVVDELLRKQTHIQSFNSTTVTPPPPCSGGAVANLRDQRMLLQESGQRPLQLSGAVAVNQPDDRADRSAATRRETAPRARSLRPRVQPITFRSDGVVSRGCSSTLHVDARRRGGAAAADDAQVADAGAHPLAAHVELRRAVVHAR